MQTDLHIEVVSPDRDYAYSKHTGEEARRGRERRGRGSERGKGERGGEGARQQARRRERRGRAKARAEEEEGGMSKVSYGGYYFMDSFKHTERT